MLAAVVAAATFQLAMSWLNADADWNAPTKFATLAVFQLLTSWLNAEAP